MSEESNKTPKKPRALYRNNVVNYVAQALELDNPEQDLIKLKRKKFVSRPNKRGIDSLDAISWLPNNVKPDLIGFTGGSANDASLGSLSDNYKPASIDTIVMIEEDIKMKNRRDLTESKLKNLLSKIAVLRNSQARRQILVLTHKATYFALREHFKYLLSYQYDQKTRISSNIQPKYFTVKDLPGLEIRLVPFPVFINDEIAPELENTSLTFSQILGGFQYGLLKLANLPEYGFLASPFSLKNTNQNDLKEGESRPSTKFWWNSKNPSVNVKEIVTYLFERSGFMKDHKGKSTYRGNSGKSAPGSSFSLKFLKEQRSKKKIEEVNK